MDVNINYNNDLNQRSNVEYILTVWCEYRDRCLNWSNTVHISTTIGGTSYCSVNGRNQKEKIILIYIDRAQSYRFGPLII
jgi:hypothetical protein